MKTKLTILIMAVSLVTKFTNVIAQENNVWFDITFGDYPDSFSAAGYDLSAIAEGQNLNTTGGMTPDGIPLTFGDYTLNFASNVFRDVPFTSVSEVYGDKNFVYAIQLRNGTSTTYIDFPTLPNVGKVVLFAYCTNVNNDDLVLQKTEDGVTWENLETETAINDPADKDKKVTFEYNTPDPVTLRLTHASSTARYLVRIFRIIVEKYGENSSVQSIFTDKIDLSVNGKTLSLSGDVSNGKLSVFDITGKQVFNCKVNSDKIDLQNINSGVYIVKLITEQGELIQKVIL